MILQYIDTQSAIKIQNEIIKLSGGFCGVKNIGQLDSVLSFIQNDAYYPTFEEKVAHLTYGINKNHAFQDGNKRSSIALSSYFLEINGYEKFFITRFIREMENIVVQVADNIICKDLLIKIIYSLLNEEEYSESLKLEILNAITIKNNL